MVLNHCEDKEAIYSKESNILFINCNNIENYLKGPTLPVKKMILKKC